MSIVCKILSTSFVASLTRFFLSFCPPGHSHIGDGASPESVGGAVGLVRHHFGAAAATVIYEANHVTQKLPDDNDDDKTRLPGKERNLADLYNDSFFLFLSYRPKTPIILSVIESIPIKNTIIYYKKIIFSELSHLERDWDWDRKNVIVYRGLELGREYDHNDYTTDEVDDAFHSDF